MFWRDIGALARAASEPRAEGAHPNGVEWIKDRGSGQKLESIRGEKPIFASQELSEVSAFSSRTHYEIER